MKTLSSLLFLALFATGTAAARDRAADIDYWTQRYDGHELALPMDGCPLPVIPDISRTNRDIKKVVASFTRWNDCYQGVVRELGPDRHPVTHVPSEVLNEMSDEQYRAAAVHMDQVYAGAVRAIGARAEPVVKRFTEWRARTEKYVDETETERKVDVMNYLRAFRR